MKYLLLIITSGGAIISSILVVSSVIELDFTSAMAWLFGVFINMVGTILMYIEIREEKS